MISPGGAPCSSHMRPPLVLSLAPSGLAADGGDFWGSTAGYRLAIIGNAIHGRNWVPAAWQLEHHYVWPSPLATNRNGPRSSLARRVFEGSPAAMRAYAACAGRHVLALGDRVLPLLFRIRPAWGVLSVVQAPTGLGSIVMAIPNPSPKNSEWRLDPGLHARAVGWVRAFYDDWRAASERARATRSV